MPVTLTDAEVEALRFALENFLPEFRYEAARVKLKRDRHEIVQMEETLTALLERLPGREGAETEAVGGS